MLLKADGVTVSGAQLVSLLNLFLHSWYGAIFKTSLTAATDVCEVLTIFSFFFFPTEGLYRSKLILK